MDLTKILVDGGPTAIIAALFIYIVVLLMKNHKEQNEAHRNEVKEMRQEHCAQVNSITEKFTTEMHNLAGEFSSGIASVKEGLNHIADELREVKGYVNRKRDNP